MKNSIPEMLIILEHNNYNTKNQTEVKNMGKNKMSSKAARRIQSHADRTGRNQGFKARDQSAVTKSKK